MSDGISHEIKLDAFHRHEALDRSHVILLMLEEVLLQHPFIKANPEISQKLEEAGSYLAQAYQMIGLSGDLE